MKFENIIKGIKELSYSQGFYGRLYNALQELKNNDFESFQQLVQEWESKNFADMLDFILYIET